MRKLKHGNLLSCVACFCLFSWKRCKRLQYFCIDSLQDEVSRLEKLDVNSHVLYAVTPPKCLSQVRIAVGRRRSYCDR